MDRAEHLHSLVSAPTDLTVEEFRLLTERAIRYQPDLIVELGRGSGNSTVALTEAAVTLGCRIVSVGIDGTFAWERFTVPALLPVVGTDWFQPLLALHLDIRETDWRWLPQCERVLLFWDAHGDDVASAVTSRLLPRLGRALVGVHDISPIGGPDGFAYMWRDLQSPYAELRTLAEVIGAQRYELTHHILWFETQQNLTLA